MYKIELQSLVSLSMQQLSELASIMTAGNATSTAICKRFDTISENTANFLQAFTDSLTDSLATKAVAECQQRNDIENRYTLTDDKNWNDFLEELMQEVFAEKYSPQELADLSLLTEKAIENATFREFICELPGSGDKIGDLAAMAIVCIIDHIKEFFFVSALNRLEPIADGLEHCEISRMRY